MTSRRMNGEDGSRPRAPAQAAAPSSARAAALARVAVAAPSAGSGRVAPPPLGPVPFPGAHSPAGIEGSADRERRGVKVLRRGVGEACSVAAPSAGGGWRRHVDGGLATPGRERRINAGANDARWGAAHRRLLAPTMPPYGLVVLSARVLTIARFYSSTWRVRGHQPAGARKGETQRRRASYDLDRSVRMVLQ
ncbi:hypothetical protein ACP70R_017521 [Stipagrostis hirtigluma subsp. patula]